ncbi:hypothetical protein Agub_g2734, partial [Astrephomene gubernaculifera]
MLLGMRRWAGRRTTEPIPNNMALLGWCRACRTVVQRHHHLLVPRFSPQQQRSSLPYNACSHPSGPGGLAPGSASINGAATSAFPSPAASGLASSTSSPARTAPLVRSASSPHASSLCAAAATGRAATGGRELDVRTWASHSRKGSSSNSSNNNSHARSSYHSASSGRSSNRGSISSKEAAGSRDTKGAPRQRASLGTARPGTFASPSTSAEHRPPRNGSSSSTSSSNSSCPAAAAAPDVPPNPLLAALLRVVTPLEAAGYAYWAVRRTAAWLHGVVLPPQLTVRQADGMQRHQAQQQQEQETMSGGAAVVVEEEGDPRVAAAADAENLDSTHHHLPPPDLELEVQWDQMQTVHSLFSRPGSDWHPSPLQLLPGGRAAFTMSSPLPLPPLSTTPVSSKSSSSSSSSSPLSPSQIPTSTSTPAPVAIVVVRIGCVFNTVLRSNPARVLIRPQPPP